MGKTANGEDTPPYWFFFGLVHDIRDTFPLVFSGGGRTKPHSKAYRDFSESWGFQKTLFEISSEEITKVSKVKQEYLTDTFLFITYLIQKQQMEEEEDGFQELLNKAKNKGRH